MTLEKLLIFGFALAAVTALTTIAANMAGERKPDYGGYQSKVNETMSKMQ